MERAFEGKALAADCDPEGEGADLAPGVRFDLVLADASWTWAEKRFAPLADLGVRLLMLKACGWGNALDQRRQRSPRIRLGGIQVDRGRVRVVLLQEVEDELSTFGRSPPGSRPHCGLRRMLETGHTLGPSPPLPELWPRRLLR
jgi:hypothetical protein